MIPKNGNRLPERFVRNLNCEESNLFQSDRIAL